MQMLTAEIRSKRPEGGRTYHSIIDAASVDGELLISIVVCGQKICKITQCDQAKN